MNIEYSLACDCDDHGPQTESIPKIHKRIKTDSNALVSWIEHFPVQMVNLNSWTLYRGQGQSMQRHAKYFKRSSARQKMSGKIYINASTTEFVVKTRSIDTVISRYPFVQSLCRLFDYVDRPTFIACRQPPLRHVMVCMAVSWCERWTVLWFEIELKTLYFQVVLSIHPHRNHNHTSLELKWHDTELRCDYDEMYLLYDYYHCAHTHRQRHFVWIIIIHEQIVPHPP